MTKREIYLQLSQEKRLPTPSKVALEVMQLCYSDTASLQDIARVVETDPGLTAEFLKYANSALISPKTSVASLQRAAVLIGLKGVVNLSLSFSLLSQSSPPECEGFSHSRFWSKSLAQAVAGRSIGAILGKVDPDEMFTFALLSHVGELGFAAARPKEYGAILVQNLSDTEQLLAEETAFGLNHHELTAEMLQAWGLPIKFIQALSLKHRYGQEKIDDNEVSTLTELLYLSLQFADICMLDLPLKRTFGSVEELAARYGIEREHFNDFFNSVVHTWQEWGYLYQVSTQQCPLYHQIKNLEDASKKQQAQGKTGEDILMLAVDDDPITLLNLTRILKSDKRTIMTAENGEDALRIAKEKEPDIVITDWLMPRLDGLQLCKILRNTSVNRHAYIIMLTGVEDDDELVQAFDAGADDYVVKPFTPKVLEARIRSGERIIRYQRTINIDREVIQEYAAKLADANRKLQNMAMTDVLTGLPNRRSAMARIKEVVSESNRYGEKLSFIMIDIDHFKKINDTYGHDNGDIVLKEIAKIFIKNVRNCDMVSRMGGEEFLVIAPRSGKTESHAIAERLREAVEQQQILLGDGTSAHVTLSAGVATWHDGYSHGEELIKAADNALYLAKNNGRNKVETSK